MQILVPGEKDGLMLSQLLVQTAADVPLWAIREAIKKRDVRIDGARIDGDVRVHAGQEIRVFWPKAVVSARQQEKPLPLPEIVFEDAHIIVVEKNIGILSMATNHHAFSVKSVLDEYFRRSKQGCTAHVVHRLDRDTSGLLVYAKSIRAEQILEHNWHEIVTDRRYVALVSGSLPKDSGTYESWLKDNKAYFTLSYPQDPGGGKWAVTHYKQVRSNGAYSLVDLKLETGRKNQIRVHLQQLGHPVCGDIKYGDGNDPLHRLCLHAYRLDFYHPMTSEPLHFETPIPKAFLQQVKG